MKKPITLYHCPGCDYEAGTQLAVIRHMSMKHHGEPVQESQKQAIEEIIKELESDKVRKAEAEGEYEQGYDHGFDDAVRIVKLHNEKKGGDE